MGKIKNYLRGIVYFYILLIIYLIIITTLNYFNVFSYQTISIINFISMIILFMVIGFSIAIKSQKKGYINGLIIGGFNIVLFLFLAFILGDAPKLTAGIYFLILLLSSTIGGMFGINYKTKKMIGF